MKTVTAKVAVFAIVVLSLMSSAINTNAQTQLTHYDSLAMKWNLQASSSSYGCRNDTCHSGIINCNRRMMMVPKTKSDFYSLGGCECGYVDSTNKIIIPLKYDGAEDFQKDSLGVVHLLNLSGKVPSYFSWHIKLNGSPLYPLFQRKYCDVYPYHNGYAIVDTDGLYHRCHINKKGERIYTQTYSWAYDFNDKERAVVVKSINLQTKKALYVVINTKGVELVSAWGVYMEMPFPKIIESEMNK
jgi:hypothetical protein